MSNFEVYLTIEGQIILNKLLAGEKISLTRAVLSSQAPELPEELTAMNPENLETTQIALTDHGNYTQIELSFQLRNLQNDLDFRSIGIYGKTNNTNEKLIYVALVGTENQMTIPAGSPITYVVSLKETLTQGKLQIDTSPSYATPISHNSDFRRHIFSQNNDSSTLALVNSGVEESFVNGDSIVFVPKVNMNSGTILRIAGKDYTLSYADIQGNPINKTFKAHKPYGLYFFNDTFVYREEEVSVNNGNLVFWTGTEYETAMSVGALQVQNGILHYYSSGAWHSTMPAGLINAFDLSSAPAGYLLCNGASVSKTTYPELFNAIGYRHGGSGNNFNLPDLRGKMILGVNGSYSLGSTGGNENKTLSVNEIPQHEHKVSGSIDYQRHKSINIEGLANGTDYGGAPLGLGGSVLIADYTKTLVTVSSSFSTTTKKTGKNQSFSLMNPYLAVNYYISTGKSLIS